MAMAMAARLTAPTMMPILASGVRFESAATRAEPTPVLVVVPTTPILGIRFIFFWS
jgi:hypothetical protein